MQKHRNAPGICKKLFLGAAALVTLAVPIALSPAHATPIQTRSQPATINPSDFKFDAVSVKPNKSGTEAFGVRNPPNAFTATNYSLQMLIHDAYGIYEEYRYAGTPGWINSDRYDIDAKVDSATADQLQKLSKTDRKLAWQRMLQVVLAERFNLKVHHETKEFPVYFLVIAKNGPKLQESKPNPDGSKAPNQGVWRDSMKNGMIILPAKMVPTEELASRLSGIVGRMVLDKTGLTGRYDFTLQFTDEGSGGTSSGGASEAQPVPSAPEPPGGVSIFTALQDQLGLKLESGKRPIEIIVIDHIERASGN